MGGFLRKGRVYVMGTLRVGEGTVIMPGVVVEGAVWAGDGCRIGPNCYLRGCVSLGNGCVVGQGVELKNCIIGDGTFIPHLSYAGIPLLAVTLISAPERYVPIFAMMAANTEWWREESWDYWKKQAWRRHWRPCSAGCQYRRFAGAGSSSRCLDQTGEVFTGA